MLERWILMLSAGLTATVAHAVTVRPAAFVVELEEHRPQTIVAYGARLTAGGAWVELFNDAINERLHHRARVIHAGRGGSSSARGLMEVDQRVISQDPDAVFIEFSIDEAFHKPAVSEARENLEAIIDHILAARPTCEIILMIMNPPIGGHARQRPDLDACIQVYRDVSEARGLKLIDFRPDWQAVLDQGEAAYRDLVPDGIHPNALGCERIILPRLLDSIGLTSDRAAAVTIRAPEQWLDDHIAMRRANGWQVTDVFSDVVALGHAATGLTQYYLRLSGEPLPWRQWRQAARAGRNYPDPRSPLRRLAKGFMLYESRLAPDWQHADDLHSREEMFDRYEARRGEVFRTMREQGLNAVVYLTYMGPERWAMLRRQADRYDIDLIIQYLAAYYHPTVRADLWDDPVRSKALKQLSLDFLGAVYADGGPSRLLGFAIREEPYLPFLEGTQQYHDLQREAFPDVKIYMLYNRSDAMHATRQPAPEIMGHNTSEFLGAFVARNRPRPAPFRPPQDALRANALRLKQTADPALRNRAVYTYTGLLAGWMKNETAEDVARSGWPAGGRIGIRKLPDGRVRFWRVYSPPAGATRASMWSSVAYNAQGWFPWSGQQALPWMAPDAHWRPDAVRDPDHIQTDQRPRWKEYLETLAEISQYERLLLRLRLDGLPRVACDDPLVVASNLRVLRQEGLHRVIVLVNLDTGRWPGYPEVNRVTGENLDIGDDGELMHYEPLTEPRDITFTVRMHADEQLRDIRTGRLLEPIGQTAPGVLTFNQQIEPGGAALLFVGSPDQWRALPLPPNRIVNTGLPSKE